MMELDDGVAWNTEMEVTNPDLGKYNLMKTFVSAAREFLTTHNELSLNALNRTLTSLAASTDISIFTPGRVEVCAFYNSLWTVMSERDGPHWTGIACLIQAIKLPTAKDGLTHTYRFMPVLAKLLSNGLNLEQKDLILYVMEGISYNCKVSWQESYIHDTVRLLIDWIHRSLEDPLYQSIGNRSLIVLTNICCSNRNMVNTLVGCVSVKEFIKKISSKESAFSGISISRLLLCLGMPKRASDVHLYLGLTLNSFATSIVEKDSSQLVQGEKFIKELMLDSQYNKCLLTYDSYNTSINTCVKHAMDLCSLINPQSSDFDNNVECLDITLKFVTLFVKLDLFALRQLHESLVNMCLKACLFCLPSSMSLLTAVVKQYKGLIDDDRLPPAIVAILRERLPALLIPPEAQQAGLEWLQLVSSLCDCVEMEEMLIEHATTQRFEDLLYGYLQYTVQLGTVGKTPMEDAVLEGLQISLNKTNTSRDWYNVTARLLQNVQVKSALRSALTSSNNKSRVLLLIKHPDFPGDKIEWVFSDHDQHQNSFESSGIGSLESYACNSVQNGLAHSNEMCMEHGFNPPLREHAITNVIAKIDALIKDNRVTDVSCKDIMELYSYKMNCLEQRMKGASDYVYKLQQIIAQTQAIDARQIDLLYKSQANNDRYKEQLRKLTSHIEDRENALSLLRLKLNSSREEQERISNEMTKQMAKQSENFQEQLAAKERAMKENANKMEDLQQNCKSLQERLEQQSNKNNDLASVLMKFEERLKQRDDKLEEAKSAESALRKDLEHKEQSIKHLEKTLLERENRLRQTTTQLEEMKKVQDMVTKLMNAQR